MGKQKVVVRFRKDVVLATYYKFSKKYRSVFVSRIKVMAHLDISNKNKNKPQDGKINFRNFAPIDVELRVATIRTAGGIEEIAIRLLSGGKCMPVNAIGVLSQRLTRTLCTSCKEAYIPEKRELEFLAVEYCNESMSGDSRSAPNDEEVIGQVNLWREDFAQKG
jgi:type II secretory ATPase GspE/PulE/Tfp pilus assembly ATPase PilB-like protein